MSQGLVVTNASPIIALDRLGRLHLLRGVFGTIAAPPAVIGEVRDRSELPDWIVETELKESIGPHVLSAVLGPGESEAIALALEQNARFLLIDDLPARRLSRTLGVPIVGTLSILVKAKSKGLISQVEPLLDALGFNEFRLSQSLRDWALREAGELPR